MSITKRSDNNSINESSNVNRLIHEHSPYLRQHAHNPVDWYPWGAEAFDKAQNENKAIFLSIGYSTCHWCHVMESESFEDEEVAALMNEAFVSIKVDREERPDIDAIYMKAALMIMGGGGWPLTIFMTPQGQPFFAATYLPKTERFGRAGMLQIIPAIQKKWQESQQELIALGGRASEALNQLTCSDAGEELTLAELGSAFVALSNSFDEKNGGFGSAPKFPTPHNLLFLLRYWQRTGKKRAISMVNKTLTEMRKGGIYDHIGFGFHRYATDAEWFAPHFEKMLYDQAMLALAYTESYQATGNSLFAQTAHEILTYVKRDLRHPDGGFFSAEDADSEGVEGKYYLWQESEIREILDPTEANFVIDTFNVEKNGNFAGEHNNETPSNILFLKKLQVEIHERWTLLRQKLFAHRNHRVKPQKDQKVLTDWNGIMIAAYAKAAQVFSETEYVKIAAEAVDFICSYLVDKDGRLLHRFFEGAVGIPAMLDDYAFLIWGLLELYEAKFDTDYLHKALKFQEQLDILFWDAEEGGYYLTALSTEKFIIRPKEFFDGAIPSGNSVAMHNLLRLSRLTGEEEFEDRAATLGEIFSSKINNTPVGFTYFLCGLDFAFGPTLEVVVVGDLKVNDTKTMWQALRSIYNPKMVVLQRQPDQNHLLDQIAKFTKFHTTVEGKATAYVCKDHVCNHPTTDVNEMLELVARKWEVD